MDFVGGDLRALSGTQIVMINMMTQIKNQLTIIYKRTDESYICAIITIKFICVP